MDHHPCCRDRVSSDLYLFGSQGKHLAGKLFATDADMKQAVTSWLQILDARFFYTGIQGLVLWWVRCLYVKSDNVGV
jgi:hypothetical protein